MEKIRVFTDPANHRIDGRELVKLHNPRNTPLERGYGVIGKVIPITPTDGLRQPADIDNLYFLNHVVADARCFDREKTVGLSLPGDSPRDKA